MPSSIVEKFFGDNKLKTLVGDFYCYICFIIITRHRHYYSKQSLFRAYYRFNLRISVFQVRI